MSVEETGPRRLTTARHISTRTMLDPLKTIAKLENELFQIAHILGQLDLQIELRHTDEERELILEQTRQIRERFDAVRREMAAVEDRYFGRRPADLLPFRKPVHFISIEAVDRKAA